MRARQQPTTVRQELRALQRVLSEYGGVGSRILGVPRVGDGGVGAVRRAQSAEDRAVLEPETDENRAQRSQRPRAMLQRVVEGVRAALPEQMRDLHGDATAHNGAVYRMIRYSNQETSIISIAFVS